MKIANCKQHFCAFWRDQSGATAIEYALIASLIAVAAASSISALGNNVETHYEEIETAVGYAQKDR